MEKTHPNIAILQQFNPANIEGSVAIIDEDAVFHYYNPMLPDLHGDYEGRQGFIDFFKGLETITNGTFKVNPLTILPMGDELVVTHVQDSMILNNQQLSVEAVVVWRIVEGKIKEAWDIPAVYTAITENQIL